MATTEKAEVCVKRGDTWNVTFTWRMWVCQASSDWVSKGEYSSDCTYTKDDLVTLAGAAYVALVDDPGDLPGPGWEKVADPVDLTDCSAWLQARLPPPTVTAYVRSQAQPLDYGAPVIDVSDVSGEITFTPLEGKVHVSVSAADMDITPAEYDSDLELTFADGTVQSTPTFILTVVEDITNDLP